MLNLIKRPKLANEKGIALIVVIMVTAIFFVLALALLFQGETEHVGVVNEQDYLKTLGYAEAGTQWAERRVRGDAQSATFEDFSDILLGPDNTDAADDYLLGLRDLSLTNANQFTNANEGTASAIVQRDFLGDGNKSYELIRIKDSPRTRALVYVRIDDNFDDDPDDPSNNDPLTDTDNRIRATVVAVYPVFVDGNGAEVPNLSKKRGRARRTLRVSFGPTGVLIALLTNGDIDMPGDSEICGECGSAHTNQDMVISGNPSLCVDATATGSWTASGNPTIGGVSGARGRMFIPVINPYDDIFVPPLNVFDTTGLILPAELQCGSPTPADPGNSKYFALVADNNKGQIFKAYWDFTNGRWTWRLIDDLGDGADVKLDDCGRAPTDPSYGAPVSDKQGDPAGVPDEFYGFKGAATESFGSCAACGAPGEDESLCSLSSNDFAHNCYYEASTLIPRASIVGSGIPALPGSFAPDGLADYQANIAQPLLVGNQWTYGADTVFSPMFNAVVFVYGNVQLSGNIGSSSAVYCASAGCGAPGSVPNDVWNISVISYGSIEVSGNLSYGPANEAADYYFLLVSGRDIKINGNSGETMACGAGCSTSAPSNVDTLSGIIVAHEQVQFSGNPQILGFVRAEDAIDCSTVVDGQGRGVSTVNGNPSIFYDCLHPPNPWEEKAQVLSWQEID